MGLVDKVQAKLSGDKNFSEADQAGGKYIGKENVSGELKNQYNQGNFTKENAAKYGDQYDKQAGKALGRENLSGTDAGLGLKYFGSEHAAKGTSGKDLYGASAGGQEAYNTKSGNIAYGSSGQDSYGTGQDSYGTGKDSYGTSGKDTYGNVSSGKESYGTTPSAAKDSYGNTAYGKDTYAAGKDSYGTTPSGANASYGNTTYGKDSYGAGKDTYGAGKDAYGSAGHDSVNTSGKDSYGTSAKDAYGSTGKDVYGASTGFGTQDTAYDKHEKSHSSKNHGTSDSKAYGTASGTVYEKKHGDHTDIYTHNKFGHANESAPSNTHSNAQSKGFGHEHGKDSGSYGNDSYGSSYATGTTGALGSGTTGHHTNTTSGSAPRSATGLSFSTGDKSLDSKIAKLDGEGQAKAKEAFERGYKDAVKNQY